MSKAYMLNQIGCFKKGVQVVSRNSCNVPEAKCMDAWIVTKCKTFCVYLNT